MQSPPFPRYLVPPRSKYSPQHHILKHPQLPFLPQCQRPNLGVLKLLNFISKYLKNPDVKKRIQRTEIVPHDNHHANRRNSNTLNTNEKCFALHSSVDSAVLLLFLSHLRSVRVTDFSVHSANTCYGF